MRGASIIMAAVLLAASCGGGKSDPTTDRCGDVKSLTRRIVGGTAEPDPGVITITAAQQDAVVMLAWTASMCSGVLVAPRVVLTAAICVDTGSASGGVPDVIAYGRECLSPDGTLAAGSVEVHPDFDMDTAPYHPAVVHLSEDATSAGLEPIPVPADVTSLVGEDVVTAGYGSTTGSVDDSGTRYWTTLGVDSEETDMYTTSGDGTNGICNGDAGGPLLWMDAGSTLRMTGLAVSGEAGCTGSNMFARIDLADTWLQDRLPATDPCEGETLTGRCEGDTAIWCESGAVQSEDCAAASMVCGLNADSQYRCTDECAALGFAGECDGDDARWCEEGEIKVRDCAACDQVCGDTGGELGFYCL